MWELTGEADEPRFLVIAHSDHDQSTPVSARPVPPAAHGVELRERLIIYGALAEPESGEMVGVALALQAPGRDAVEALLGVVPKHVGSSGPPWRLRAAKHPSPRRQPDEAPP
jgi:hypothetical protein